MASTAKKSKVYRPGMTLPDGTPVPPPPPPGHKGIFTSPLPPKGPPPTRAYTSPPKGAPPKVPPSVKPTNLKKQLDKEGDEPMTKRDMMDIFMKLLEHNDKKKEKI